MFKKAAGENMNSTYNVKPMLGFAPSDVMNIVCMFAFDVSWDAVRREVPFCAMVQDCVPPTFITAELACRHEWGRVPNPYKRFNPFTPREMFCYEHPWSFVAGKLAHSICRRSIRSIKTYRGVMMRHALKMMNGGIMEWNTAWHKVWNRLDASHFRRNVSGSFLSKMLEEIKYSSPLLLSL